jgi:GAF domain-containing protein
MEKAEEEIPSFARLTRLAAGLLSAPVSLLTFVEVDRQFFLSSYGLPEPIRSARQTALEYSICQYVVAGGRPVIINDTAQDMRLRRHLAVTELGVAAYAGMPLFDARGYAGGALAVVDFVPRDWTGDKLAILANLANVATEELRGCGWLKPSARRRIE